MDQGIGGQSDLGSIHYTEPFDPKFPTVYEWANSCVLGDTINGSSKF